MLVTIMIFYPAKIQIAQTQELYSSLHSAH